MPVPMSGADINWTEIESAGVYAENEFKELNRTPGQIDLHNCRGHVFEAVHNRALYIATDVINYGIRSEFHDGAKLTTVESYFRNKYGMILDPQPVIK
jgi:hypothetical protein